MCPLVCAKYLEREKQRERGQVTPNVTFVDVVPLNNFIMDGFFNKFIIRLLRHVGSVKTIFFQVSVI